MRKSYLAMIAKRNRHYDLYLISLATVWIFGLIIGRVCAHYYVSNYATSLLFGLSDADCSVFGFITIGILPLIVSVILTKIQPILLLLIVFLKSTAFSFASVLIIGMYAEAGWLVRWLLLFTDSFSVVLLLYFWCVCPTRDATHLQSQFYVLLLLLIVIAYFDCFVVLPFSAMLL